MATYNEKIQKVSIAMCTYNGEKYLREQLDSIVAQTYPIYELIIQDDQSTDGTITIIKEYAAHYSYIRWKINEKNLGYNTNFRTAIQDAKGDLIAIADQDDIWYPNKLEELVKCIGRHSMSYAYSTTSVQNTVSNIKQAINYNNTLERLLFTNVIPGHAMLLQREFIEQIPCWNDHIFYDWWLAVNAYLFNGAVQCEQILTYHRLHQESVMAGYKNKANKKYLPYLKGYTNFQKLQKGENWQWFYQYIYNTAQNKKGLEVAHRVAGLMLKRGIPSFISLCWLSLKYKHLLMPRLSINLFRSFFYPCFAFYNNHLFDSRK